MSSAQAAIDSHNRQIVEGAATLADPTPKPKHYEISVKCPWPWCEGRMRVTTEDLDFLLRDLATFRTAHANCEPTFKFQVKETF